MRYVLWLVGSLAAVISGPMATSAEVDNKLAVAIGQPGSPSFAFGIELWAMSQIALMPTYGIKLTSKEVAADDERLLLLEQREVEAALISDPISKAGHDDLRSMIALWPEGVSRDDTQPTRILLHKDVAADVVYLVTKAMFEQDHFFKSSHADLGIGLPSEALAGLDLPLHDGAYRYFDETGFGAEAMLAAAKGDDERPLANGELALTTVGYRSVDGAALERHEIDQIAAACRHAFDSGGLAVLGDLENTGCEAYQDLLQEDLIDGSLPAAMTSAKSAPLDDKGDSLFVLPVGQGGPAIRWSPSRDEMKTGVATQKPAPIRVLRQPTM